MKPMLAKPFEARFIQPPGYLQPKLDGVRLIWTGGEALSRTGKPILGVPLLVEHLREHYADFPLDGELYSHGRSFQSFLGSIRKTKNVDEDLTVAYCVYDHPVPGLTYYATRPFDLEAKEEGKTPSFPILCEGVSGRKIFLSSHCEEGFNDYKSFSSLEEGLQYLLDRAEGM